MQDEYTGQAGTFIVDGVRGMRGVGRRVPHLFGVAVVGRDDQHPAALQRRV